MTDKKIKCVSMVIYLCGNPLKNVIGYMGRKKKNLGIDISKHNALLELLGGECDFTEDELNAGMEISQRRSRKKQA